MDPWLLCWACAYSRSPVMLALQGHAFCHDMHHTTSPWSVVPTIFSQRLFPSLALAVAVTHIEHVLNQRNLQLPQLHPLQLRETDSKPAFFPLRPVFALGSVPMLLPLDTAHFLTPPRNGLDTLLDVILGFLSE